MNMVEAINNSKLGDLLICQDPEVKDEYITEYPDLSNRKLHFNRHSSKLETEKDIREWLKEHKYDYAWMTGDIWRVVKR